MTSSPKIYLPPRRAGRYYDRSIAIGTPTRYNDIRLFYRHNDKLCPIFESLYKGDKTIKGSYGEVKIALGLPDYAVKRIPLEVSIYTVEENASLEEVAKLNRNEPSIIATLNNLPVTYRFIEGDQIIILPMTVEILRQPKYVYTASGPLYMIPRGSVMDASGYVESIIALTAAEMYRSGINIHLIDTLATAFCDSISDEPSDLPQLSLKRESLPTVAVLKERWSTFLLMERINFPLVDVRECVKPQTDAYFIQALSAIAALQTKKIVHNDMHLGNVFLQKTTDAYAWGDFDPIEKFVYVFYDVDKIDSAVEIPYTPYIVKIGDWGLSCMHTEPMFISSNAANAAVTITYWDSSYDPIVLLVNFYINVQRSPLINRMIAAYMATDLELDLLKESMKGNETLMANITRRFLAILDPLYKRPTVNKPTRSLGARDLLTDPWVMGEYYRSKNLEEITSQEDVMVMSSL